ncbi:MAG: hypothetical protein Q9221_004947 [Calogaya cf. arnoldii]
MAADSFPRNVDQAEASAGLGNSFRQQVSGPGGLNNLRNIYQETNREFRATGQLQVHSQAINKKNSKRLETSIRGSSQVLKQNHKDKISGHQLSRYTIPSQTCHPGLQEIFWETNRARSNNILTASVLETDPDITTLRIQFSTVAVTATLSDQSKVTYPGPITLPAISNPISDPIWAGEARELVIAYIDNMQHQRDLVEAVQEALQMLDRLMNHPAGAPPGPSNYAGLGIRNWDTRKSILKHSYRHMRKLSTECSMESSSLTKS